VGEKPATKKVKYHAAAGYTSPYNRLRVNLKR
jgi:hypothetical protein